MQNLLCNNVILVFSTSPEVSKIRNFLITILQCGLRNDFFFQFQFTFSNFYLDFYFPFLSGLLFPFSLWTFISLFSLDFYFPFHFGLLFPFFLWTFIFPFVFGLLFSFSLLTFIQSRSHFGFLPNF